MRIYDRRAFRQDRFKKEDRARKKTGTLENSKALAVLHEKSNPNKTKTPKQRDKSH